jgi:hypothetical protein
VNDCTVLKVIASVDSDPRENLTKVTNATSSVLHMGLSSFPARRSALLPQVKFANLAIKFTFLLMISSNLGRSELKNTKGTLP